MKALHIEIHWAHGSPSRHLILEEDLGGQSWDDWVEGLLHSSRPCWTKLGDLVFHTQTVQSIEVLAEIEHDQEV